MNRPWKEPYELTRQRNLETGVVEARGACEHDLDPAPGDYTLARWAFFVTIEGFTFQFLSLRRLQRAIRLLPAVPHVPRRFGSLVALVPAGAVWPRPGPDSTARGRLHPVCYRRLTSRGVQTVGNPFAADTRLVAST
jgi:hypothetical protein